MAFWDKVGDFATGFGTGLAQSMPLVMEERRRERVREEEREYQKGLLAESRDYDRLLTLRREALKSPEAWAQLYEKDPDDSAAVLGTVRNNYADQYNSAIGSISSAEDSITNNFLNLDPNNLNDEDVERALNSLSTLDKGIRDVNSINTGFGRYTQHFENPETGFEALLNEEDHEILREAINKHREKIELFKEGNEIIMKEIDAHMNSGNYSAISGLTKMIAGQHFAKQRPYMYVNKAARRALDDAWTKGDEEFEAVYEELADFYADRTGTLPASLNHLYKQKVRYSKYRKDGDFKTLISALQDDGLYQDALIQLNDSNLPPDEMDRLRTSLLAKEHLQIQSKQTALKTTLANDLATMRQAASERGMGLGMDARGTTFDENQAIRQLLSRQLSLGKDAVVHRWALERNAGGSDAVVPFMTQHILIDVAYQVEQWGVQRSGEVTVGPGGDPALDQEKGAKEVGAWEDWKEKILNAKHFSFLEKEKMLGSIDEQLLKLTGVKPDSASLIAQSSRGPLSFQGQERPFDLFTTDVSGVVGEDPYELGKDLQVEELLYPISSATTRQKENLVDFVETQKSLTEQMTPSEAKNRGIRARLRRQVQQKVSEGLFPKSVDTMKVLEEIMGVGITPEKAADQYSEIQTEAAEEVGLISMPPAAYYGPTI